MLNSYVVSSLPCLGSRVQFSFEVAKLAAGCVLELTQQVVAGNVSLALTTTGYMHASTCSVSFEQSPLPPAIVAIK